MLLLSISIFTMTDCIQCVVLWGNKEKSPYPPMAHTHPSVQKHMEPYVLGNSGASKGYLSRHRLWQSYCYYYCSAIPFHSILFHSIPFHAILFHSMLFYSMLFYSILFYSIPFYSNPFHSILLYSIPYLVNSGGSLLNIDERTVRSSQREEADCHEAM